MSKVQVGGKPAGAVLVRMMMSVGVAGKGLVEKPVQPLRCRVAPAVQGHREDVVIDWQVRERGATAEEGC